jgi:alpha-tubulin suppressor-like RCC1 family protein
LAIIVLVVGCGDNERSGLQLDATDASISGNYGELCALDVNGTLRCLLDGPWGNRSVSQKPGRWSSVAAGTTHSCAIDTDGKLWCWGRNCVGQLRDGSRSHEDPSLIESELTWKQVAVGGGKTCAIDSLDDLYCWGGLDYHQSDCDYASHPIIQIDPTRHWKSVSSSWYVVDAITSDNERVRMNDPRGLTDPWQPVVEELPGTWASVTSGVHMSCGLRVQGEWACLDHSATSNVPVFTAADALAAIASSYHHCALDDAGDAWCAGRNDAGQVDPDDPSMEIEQARRQEGPFTGLVTLADGTCVSAGSTVTCWGGLTSE